MYPENSTLYRIIDNPEYFDRYTLAFLTDDGLSFIVGASVDPFAPGGFGQYCGDWHVPEDQDMGAEISFDDLPEPVQRYAAMIEG
jgi:hypothetical protein